MHPELKRAEKGIRSTKKQIFVQVLLVFIVPVALLYYHVIPLSMRVPVLAVATSGFVAYLVLVEGWTSHMFGIRKGEFSKFFGPYLVFTVSMMLVLVLFGEYAIKTEELKRWWTSSHFLYLFFFVSLFQEVAYRGYLVPALGKMTKSLSVMVLANILLFTFLHIIFPNPIIGLPVAFVGGAGFVLMYLRYPSLPLVVLSHAALNFCAVLYGFFIIPGLTH